EVKNPVLNIDHDAKSAEIVYSVDPGKIAIVSNIEISGEQKVPESLILKRIGLQLQSVLNASAIERAKINLTETGLFSNINIFASKGIETEKNQGTLLNVNVVEAPPRLVGAGVSYSASEGVLFQANWQHKNFLQKGHNIGTHLYLGQKELSSIIFLNIPDAFSVNQKLHFDVTLKHFDTKAYNGEKASATIGIIQSTQIKNNETEISFLPTFEHGTLKRKKKSYKQNIGGLKSNIKLNCSNHRLYPTKGIVFNIDLEQYFGQFGKIVLATESNLEKVDFNKKVNSLSVITGTISSYIPLSKKDEYEQNATILAAFIKIGGTVIKDLEYIPFDKRFYGGGRNSIRSYGYQMSGELESDGTPIGGASIIESCLESRFRISEDFGMVAFLDYSCITSEKTPSFYKENSCRYGYGFGVRYFTKFGPIRLDIGLPFTRRKDMNGKKIDKVIQFYVSVGQAF
ncbi:MAG: BamA/TamA family outer membrane protein, partial [Holosporales bacterium]|nr:BamA/TamA family outer membrane protein [Holosporales bacterium]